MHADALVALVGAGVPVYAEKPVVTSRGDLERVRRALDTAEKPAPSLAGCNLRFLPSLQRVRDLLRDGACGRLVRASLQAGFWLPHWRPGEDYERSYSAHSARGGGVVLDLIHELDAARWLFGEFSWVEARAGRFSGLCITSEDTACVLLEREGGPLVSLGLDYVSRTRMRRYEVVGDAATLVWDQPACRLELHREGGSELLDLPPESSDVEATYAAGMAALLACVRDGCSCSGDLREGLRSAELALAVKEAASR